MRTSTMKILGALVLAALAAAWWLARKPEAPAAAAGADTAFLAGFREQVNQVTKIEIDDGKEPLIVEKSGAGWVDPQRGNYPVKADEVKRLLLALNGLQKKEAKTSNPQLHGQLQLALDGGDEQRGKLLRLWTGGAEPAWEIVAGMPKWSPVRGLYARLKSDDQCWFISGELQLPYAATAWLDKEMMNVNQQDVARVVLVRGAETFTIARPDGNSPWTLAELPEGRALKDPSPFGTLANSLGYLNFDDVARADDARFARDPDLAAEFTCFNGAQLRLTGWREGEATWVRCEATPPPATADPAEPADPAAPAERGPSAATVQQWSAKWQGWIYQLPDWKSEGLQQGLENWLAPLPAPPAADAPPADEAPPAGDAPPPPEGGEAPPDGGGQ